AVACIGGMLIGAAPVPTEPQLAPADKAQVDALALPLINGLIAGKATEAIAAFLGKSAMMQGKQSDVAFLGAQAEAAIAAYGPIRACDLDEEATSSKWSQTRLYICQHDKYLTRWILVVFKSPSGWQPASINFDDKFSNPIGQ